MLQRRDNSQSDPKTRRDTAAELRTVPRITRTRRGEENNTGVKAGDKQALGAGAPAIATGHFLPLLAPCRQDLRPLPSRKGFAAWSQAPPAPHRFNFSSRAGGGGEQGRSLLQGHSMQAPMLRHPLQAWRNLYLYLTGAFQPQKQGHSAGPDSHPVPIFPSAPFPPQGIASLHWNCLWFYTAPASFQAELGVVKALQLPRSGSAEDWSEGLGGETEESIWNRKK